MWALYPRPWVQWRWVQSSCLPLVRVMSWQAPPKNCKKKADFDVVAWNHTPAFQSGGALTGGVLAQGGNGGRAPKVGDIMCDGIPCGGTTVLTGFSGLNMALGASGSCPDVGSVKLGLATLALSDIFVSATVISSIFSPVAIHLQEPSTSRKYHNLHPCPQSVCVGRFIVVSPPPYLMTTRMPPTLMNSSGRNFRS